MNEWHFSLQISLSLSLSLFLSLCLLLLRVKTSVVWKRETGTRKTQTQTGRGPLYWPFPNPLCDSIFRASSLCFLEEWYSTGGRLQTALPNCPRMTLSVTLWLCIYHFITAWQPLNCYLCLELRELRSSYFHT